MPIASASSSRPGNLLLALVAVTFALALLAPAAPGRDLYTADYESNQVSVIDSATGAQVVPPISTGPESGPYTLAISPDGGTVYAVNYNGDSVSTIDTRTKSVVGTPIPVGENPLGIAISPDGRRAVVSNQGSDDVTVIDLQARQPIATLPVGNEPQGVAINPSGARAFVTNSGGETVNAIDLASNQLVGGPIAVGLGPYGIAVTPDGSKLLVANGDANTLSVLDGTSGAAVGAPIPAGPDPVGVAISPNGQRAFVTNWTEGAASVIDIPSLARIGSIPGLAEAEYVAITPDGRKGFTSAFGAGNVYAFDPLANSFLGGPFVTGGLGIGQIAAVPNQPPAARFSVAPVRARPGVPVNFEAAASTDPDGSVASFAWAFGDGVSLTTATPGASHVFAKPGTYATTLTLTDNEGCSTSMVFTGQTAYCNGSAVASTAATVTVAYPGARVKCPKSAKGACKFVLQAVQRKGGKKPKLKALSAVARVKVKPGKAAIVSLKPKKAFRNKLATAKRILVKEKRTVAGVQLERVRKLKIVQ
jgi:YVTN family beta-propeller protein